MLTRKEELKDRIESNQQQLQARLAELEGDTRSEAAQERSAIRAKLAELEEHPMRDWNDAT